MRLINTRTFELTQFDNPASIPPYAILSHTWSEDRDGEVTFQQFTTLSHETLAQGASKQGFTKIQQTCRLARERDLGWAWVDTCCIDKTSSAELTEAINSMWRWYVGAEVCFAFLADLELEGKTVVIEAQDEKTKGGTLRMAASVGVVTGLGRCRWFTRGWTLQELIVPRRLEFYNKDWEFCGEKSSMRMVLSRITSIRPEVFRRTNLVPTLSVAERMSWAATRQTRHTEDTAYCLLGIFGVNMPLLYGEGEKAFARLQEEIIKESNDMSLFAWRMTPEQSARQTHWGIFAPSPREFAECDGIDALVDPMHRNECAITSKGLRVTPVPGGLQGVASRL
ncbi:hypothetical protein NEMBOFW57_004244 [Staphylotrichum longicolle]|uniref:HET-domain-containing protein n=1 Tax=Staphylotrichum longicolle TaxID=669026 RepID=A0AAD4F7K7_9PEZI|nr:hypothetical protein NEMBOFW57_004244 [Staphylotrichum longicolle]